MEQDRAMLQVFPFQTSTLGVEAAEVRWAGSGQVVWDSP